MSGTIRIYNADGILINEGACLEVTITPKSTPLISDSPAPKFVTGTFRGTLNWANMRRALGLPVWDLSNLDFSDLRTQPFRAVRQLRRWRRNKIRRLVAEQFNDYKKSKGLNK